MRFARFATVIAVCLLTLGCNVSTIHPLYSKEVAVYDPGLVGTWLLDGGQVSLSNSADGDGYAIVVKSRNETRSYSGRLVELGGQRFWDCLSTKQTGPDAVPVHHVFRVMVNQDTLRVAVADRPKVEAILSRDSVLGGHSVRNGGQVVLTGSTAEVQTFFRTRGGDIFSRELTFKRQ